MNGARADVEGALSRATRLAGSDVLRQPRRLRALLADLVGRVGGDHRMEIDALVGVAGELEERRVSDDEVLAALRRRGVDDDTTRWALATLVGQPGSRAGRRPESRTRRRAVQIGAAVVALAAPLVGFLVLSGDGGDGSDAMPGASAAPSSTDPLPATGDFLVTFDDTTEGAFLVSRTWEVSGGSLFGTVTLTPTGEGDGTAQHRELVPAEAFADPTFTPQPASIAGDVAIFNIDQAGGQPFIISFAANVTTETPDAVAVQAWIDGWRERVVDLRPLDPTPPANASITAQ